MKISLIIVAGIILICVLIYTMLDTDNSVEIKSDADQAPSTQFVGGITDEIKKVQDEALTDDDLTRDKRRREMQDAYSQLQQLRKQLKSQVNLLKSRTWGIELPSDQARDISNKMRQAYAYLKNPAMQGAYFEVNEIWIESRKVEAMQEDLTAIEQLLGTLRERDQ